MLSGIYARLLDEYWGDALVARRRARRMTWARIPHFFQSPYYVYQYATCFASTAKLMNDVQQRAIRRCAQAAVDRYLDAAARRRQRLPDEPARRAGVDLSEPDTVRAVVEQLDGLVTRLESSSRRTLR